MIVLVCGGRDFNDYAYMREVMDHVHKVCYVDLLINGDSAGADRAAQYWTRQREIPFLCVPAQWSLYQNAAGPMRNARMLGITEKVDIVVAFPGGAGTQNMIDTARTNNIYVLDTVSNPGLSFPPTGRRKGKQTWKPWKAGK